MSIQKIVLILSVVLCSAKAYTQQTESVVSGTVVDQSSKLPIEFANVRLLKAGDSSLVSVTATDKKGNFIFEKIIPGHYVLQCTFTGFTKTAVSVSVSSIAKLKLGVIEMPISSTTMKQVIITTKKGLLNTSIDRKIYNVSQDIMAPSGSASDILKNIPSVEVDIEGEVTLRGSTDVIILINGKPSPLMGKTRAEVLQQLPANSIERIEVITNPSAKYKPDGTSGIINIVLKKNIKAGWNGSLIANAGNHNRYNGGITFNYKPGKLNLFGNYNIRQDSRVRLYNTNRQYLDSTGKIESYYTEDNRSPTRPLSHNVAAGMDYNLDEHNTMGISGTYHYRDQTKHDVVKKFFYDKNQALTSNYNRLRYDPEFEKEKVLTAYWQHNFSKEDHELNVEFNMSASNEKEDNHYSNAYFFPALPTSMDNTVIKQDDKQQELTIDYSNPLSEDTKLEAGYDGSFNQIDMNFYGEYYDTAQHKFIKDIIKSNQFKYTEAIHALYATYQHSYEKFGYSAGLRLEEAMIRGNLVTKDSFINNDYFKFYPTLHLSYKLKKGELQLNYSKRVHRAEGDDLNPFPEYQDPNNLRAGNSKLLPEIIHSVEFGYKWQNDKFSFVPSIYYRYKLNGFTTVTIPLNDSVLLSTIQNLSNDKSAGLELIFSAKLGKTVSSNLSANFFYNRINASNLGYSAQRSIISMSTNFNTTVTLTKTTLMQVSCNVRSARLTPQGTLFGTFLFNVGMRQDLFKKKVSLTLTASDPFKTLKQRSELNSQYLKQQATGRRDAQVFYLGISYRFGKLIKKNPEEKIQFDENL